MALLIHVVLGALLVMIPQNKVEVMKVSLVSTEDSAEEKTQSENKTPHMKTFAVDSKQIQLQLEKIKQQEQKKLNQHRQLAKQTQAEKKRLVEIKKKQKIEQNKLAAEKRNTLNLKKIAEKAKKDTKLAEKQRLVAKKKAEEAEKKTKKLALEIKKRDLKNKQLATETLLQQEMAEEAAQERKLSKAKDMQNLKEVYISNIASTVRSNWRTVGRVSHKAECTISITQTPRGNVSSVKVHSCNRYSTNLFKKDAEKAVYRSQPLPKPPVDELFERKIDFIFKP